MLDATNPPAAPHPCPACLGEAHHTVSASVAPWREVEFGDEPGGVAVCDVCLGAGLAPCEICGSVEGLRAGEGGENVCAGCAAELAAEAAPLARAS